MRVTLAYPWTDDRGQDGQKKYEADDTVDLDDSTATNLIARGWAREADAAATSSTKKGA